jgi:phosphate starvation-inducible PhoH-like protein/PhoH-like ATPase
MDIAKARKKLLSLLKTRRRDMSAQYRESSKKRKAKRPQQPSEKISFNINHIQPLTNNQKLTFREYNAGKHLMLHGIAGTGKSFLSMYLSLNQVLSENSPYKKIVIIRTVVPTRDVGFLPGNAKEKTKVYEAPYQAICTELFGRGDAYEYLKARGVIEFMSTSFVRGITLSDCIVIVDEMQNANGHELDSVITRVGNNCRVIFSGDFRQSDFTRDTDKNGLHTFIEIIKSIRDFSLIEFDVEDIVRSQLVKEYIIAKSKLSGEKTL